jgi:hypothetical protein
MKPAGGVLAALPRRLQWLVRAIQQARKQARLLSRLLGISGLGLGAYVGLKLSLLAVEPLVEAHAGLRGALRLVGTLAFGQGLRRLQNGPPLVAIGFGRLAGDVQDLPC